MREKLIYKSSTNINYIKKNGFIFRIRYVIMLLGEFFFFFLFKILNLTIYPSITNLKNKKYAEIFFKNKNI